VRRCRRALALIVVLLQQPGGLEILAEEVVGDGLVAAEELARGVGVCCEDAIRPVLAGTLEDVAVVGLG